MMNRRNALKLLGSAGLTAFMPSLLNRALAQAMDPVPWSGPLYIVIQANGGWDVTSFCDPKENIPGQPIINTWAQTGSTQQAGNLSYAPFANNQALFEKYYSYMLVVNGVDSQTNAHDAGKTHNWSGRLSAGFPSFPALLSSITAPTLPMSFLTNGGYAETARLIRATRVNNIAPLNNILFPNTPEILPGDRFFDQDDLDIVTAASSARLTRLQAQNALLPRQQNNRDIYAASLGSSDGFDAFAALLPSEEELQPTVDDQGNPAPLKQQAQLALLAFKAGVSMTADLTYNVFDTHTNHDALQSTGLSNLADAIDFVWDFAEQQGIADRLTVYVASDFGRTPRYNSNAGKDHWPIGSAIFMRKNAPWGNRVVGLTDAGHNAQKIDPVTLQADDSNGVLIHPGHLMDALRRLATIDSDPLALKFPLKMPESIDFFQTG